MSEINNVIQKCEGCDDDPAACFMFKVEINDNVEMKTEYYCSNCLSNLFEEIPELIMSVKAIVGVEDD